MEYEKNMCFMLFLCTEKYKYKQHIKLLNHSDTSLFIESVVTRTKGRLMKFLENLSIDWRLSFLSFYEW